MLNDGDGRRGHEAAEAFKRSGEPGGEATQGIVLLHPSDDKPGP